MGQGSVSASNNYNPNLTYTPHAANGGQINVGSFNMGGASFDGSNTATGPSFKADL